MIQNIESLLHHIPSFGVAWQKIVFKSLTEAYLSMAKPWPAYLQYSVNHYWQSVCFPPYYQTYFFPLTHAPDHFLYPCFVPNRVDNLEVAHKPDKSIIPKKLLVCLLKIDYVVDFY